MIPRLLLPLLLCAMASACGRAPETASAVGDVARGKVLTGRLGCGSCHAIPGISGANGQVGPPLADIGQRTIIAGVLPNTPTNMIAWLKAPQSVTPGNAMPNMELNDNDARDIAAYLYTLRR